MKKNTNGAWNTMLSMVKRVICLLMILALTIPVACFADGSAWYCPQCGRRNEGNYCPADGTACPSMASEKNDFLLPTYSFSRHSLDFPDKINAAVYTGPGTGYVRAANGKAQFIGTSYKYAGLDGDWMFVRCQVKGGVRYGYINVSAYRRTVQNVPQMQFGYTEAVITRSTGLWDSLRGLPSSGRNP